MKTVSISQREHAIEKPRLAAGWCWLRLDELAASEPNAITDGPFGSKLKTEHYTETGPRVIRLQNIGDGVFRDEKACIAESHFLTLARHQVEAGDLVVAALGEELPRACVIPDWLGQAIVKADCIRVKPDERLALPKFLNFALNFEQTRKRTGTIIHGVGRPRLNLTEIKSIEVPIAPLEEQRRIVAKIEELFSDLDAGVAALERVRANLKRYRASVLKAAVEGKLTEDWRAQHPDTEPADTLLERILTDRRRQWEKDQLAKFAQAGKQPPKGWEAKYKEPVQVEASVSRGLPHRWCMAKLGQVAAFQNGHAFPSSQYQDEGVKLLRPGNLFDDGSVRWNTKNTKRLPERWAEEHPDHMVRGGELIMNLTAQSLRDEFLGRTCLTSEHESCLLNQRLARISPCPGLDTKFALYLLKSATFRSYVSDLNTGSLIQHMFTSQLEHFAFPLPPESEQRSIVLEIERRLSIVSEIEAQVDANLKRAARLRQGILKRAFEGRLVPQDPTDEPAETLLERIREQRHANRPDPNGSTRTRRGRRPRNAGSALPLFGQDGEDSVS